MGAHDFTVLAEGEDLQRAFAAARENAAYEHGHGGYTGTVAEKDQVVVIERTPLTETAAHATAQALLDAGDSRIADKWGPAGAIAVGDAGTVTGWLLFGWASA